MIKQKIYFALWAEDISQYIHTGYNTLTISGIESALRSYISVDEEKDDNYNQLSLSQIIEMTGLSLDYSNAKFEFLDELSDRTLNQRSGFKVPMSFLR